MDMKVLLHIEYIIQQKNGIFDENVNIKIEIGQFKWKRASKGLCDYLMLFRLKQKF